jgi:glucose/arabinose dehydrogenase
VKTLAGARAGISIALCAVLAAACSGNGAPQGARATPMPSPTASMRIQVASGFSWTTIASVPDARELVALPNGDLLVGTSDSSIWIVPDAEAARSPGGAHEFITLPDTPAQGIALSADGTTIFAATEYDVFAIAYRSGDQSESSSDAHQIASVRTGQISPGSDGDVHITSSVAATSSALYVGVGSSCNACVEVDPTRASIQAMNLDGSGMHTIATRIRNPIALAIDPASGVLWAAGAGQDDLPYLHPYEFLDAVTLQPGSPVDYGWPDCEENRVAYVAGSNCSSVAVPRVEFPAYATHIGATIYPAGATGAYVFPSAYRGGIFVSSHGSWHCCPSMPPEVRFVPMNGDAPKIAVDWNDPSAQWTGFMWGFGTPANTAYIGRVTGIAVGSQGSLFVADDQNGAVYRIRPAAAAAPRAVKSHRGQSQAPTNVKHGS